MPSELRKSQTLHHNTPRQFVDKKECDEKGRHKVSIQNFDQISESKAMSGPASLRVTIRFVFGEGSSHGEKVKGKVDILLNSQETQNTCRQTVNEVCELWIYNYCVAMNSKNLIDFLRQSLMVSAQIHTKELFNIAFRVTESGPHEYERLEGKDQLDFGFVRHPHKATWKHPMTQVCKYEHQSAARHVERQICLSILRWDSKLHDCHDNHHRQTVVKDHEKEVKVVIEVATVLKDLLVHGNLLQWELSWWLLLGLCAILVLFPTRISLFNRCELIEDT